MSGKPQGLPISFQIVLPQTPPWAPGCCVAGDFCTGCGIAQTPRPPNLKDLQKLVNDAKLDAAKAQSDPLDYGYDLFIYANWPALLKGRGRPDPRKHFGDTGTVLWETWKNSAETFRPCGLTPDGWEKAGTRAVTGSIQAAATCRQREILAAHDGQHAGGRLQFEGPAGQRHPLPNSQEPEHVRLHRKAELFNIDGQVAFAAATRQLEFQFRFDRSQDGLDVAGSPRTPRRVAGRKITSPRMRTYQRPRQQREANRLSKPA